MADVTGNNILFLSLHDKETITIKKLSETVTVDNIKAQFELVTGIHGNSFDVTYRGLPLEDESLSFNKNIRNGAVMKIVLSEELKLIYEAVIEANVQKVIHFCLSELDKEDEDSVLTTEDRRLFSLLTAASKGNLDVVQALTCQDSEGTWKKQCTGYGRTLAHIAAASDQMQILNFLLQQDAPVHTQDCFSNSPFDIALKYGAYTSERLLRQSFLSKKGRVNHGHELRKEPKKSKVCWGDISGYSEAPIKSYMQQQSSATCSISPMAMLSGTSFSPSRQSSARKSHQYPTADEKHKDILKNEGCQSHKTSKTGKCTHKSCISLRPFMAYRTVTPQELRPLAVEYVPLDTISYEERKAMLHKFRALGKASSEVCPSAPFSSLNNSLENLQSASQVEEGSELDEKEKILHKRQMLMKEYSGHVKNRTSCRAQSAKYYRTRYHLEAEQDNTVPKPRPSTAGPRYREWKTWMLEKLEQDEENSAVSRMDTEQQVQNEQAFKKWLLRKNRQGYSSEDSDSEYSSDNEENDKAYQKWLEKKKNVFDQMDKKRKEFLKTGSQHQKPRRPLGDKTVPIFELGVSEDSKLETPKPDHYMRAFQHWKDNRKRWENWKKRKGVSTNQSSVSNEEFLRMREALLLQGMTYEEWLGLKDREKNGGRLHFQNIR